MSADDRAAELLADLDSKADAAIAAVREKAQDVKSRLESGVMNLQSQGSAVPMSHVDETVPELNWDLEAEAAAETPPEAPAPPLESDEDFRITAPEPVASFKDELDVATDELGIPLGD